ncbi:MAG: FAD synthase [Candidatus Diapherotrites archaeon]|nr:FAD synthase [Candidatus Diapherotrites archaeon]
MKKVMVFGTFDVIHRGHLRYLREAKKFGDYLIVVVSRDINALKIKGKKPVHNEQERLNSVQGLPMVAKAVLGDVEPRSWLVIKKHRPVVIALGYDQLKTEASLMKQLKTLEWNPRVVRIKGLNPRKYNTTRILNNAEKYAE